MPGRAGLSLVELVVAVLLIELAAVAALGTMLRVERQAQRTARGATADLARWHAYHQAWRSAPCTGGSPLAVLLDLPATPDRPAFPAILQCGR